MAFPRFVSGSSSLTLTSHLSYPVSKPIRSDKARIRLAGGGYRSETVGEYPIQSIKLSFKHLSEADVLALRDWILYIARWDAVPFTYYDEKGIQWKVIVKSEEFDPVQVSYWYYELNIEFEVVP